VHDLWTEEMGHACSLIIQSPSSSLANTISHEAWTGKKPFLKHLILVGFDVYVHVPKENRAS